MNRYNVAEIYKEYSGIVENISIKGTHNWEAAEDVKQQVFMKVFESLDSFRNECQLKTWIYRITLNECFHYRLKNWREKRKIEAFLENSSEANDEVGRWDDKILVRRILDLADTETKQSLKLMYVKGLTQEQVAKAQGISRVTVTKRLDKFRKVAVAALGEVM